MKTFALILLFALLPVVVWGQILNGGFEEWTTESGGTKPAGWTTSSFGVGKDSSPHSGDDAVSVWTWYTYAPGFITSDTTGKTQYFSLDQGGFPIDFVPEKLTGYYKFVRGDAPDSAAGTVIAFFRWYSPFQGRSDTVSYVHYSLPPSAEWAPFEITIPRPIYDMVPDTMVIGFFSTDPTHEPRITCNNTANECCYLSVDDVALTTTSGVSYTLDHLMTSAQAVPNPVVNGNTRIRFNAEAGKTYRMKIHNASGQFVLERDVVGSEADLSDLRLPSGSYMISIVDPANSPVATGRFIVE